MRCPILISTYIVYRMNKEAATPNNNNMVKKCLPLMRCCVGGER